MARKKIEYTFRYNGRAIQKSNFLRELGVNENTWKRKCVRDQFGIYHYGYYSATPND